LWDEVHNLLGHTYQHQKFQPLASVGLRPNNTAKNNRQLFFNVPSKYSSSWLEVQKYRMAQLGKPTNLPVRKVKMGDLCKDDLGEELNSCTYMDQS